MTQTQTRPDSISGDAATAETIAAIERFNEAFNRHDVDAIMAAMTDDCVFESTGPAPDGPRFVGQDAVRAVWEDFFRSSPHAYFDVEEMFAVGVGNLAWMGVLTGVMLIEKTSRHGRRFVPFVGATLLACGALVLLRGWSM